MGAVAGMQPDNANAIAASSGQLNRKCRPRATDAAADFAPESVSMIHP
jgi:hypothetical protein